MGIDGVINGQTDGIRIGIVTNPATTHPALRTRSLRSRNVDSAKMLELPIALSDQALTTSPPCALHLIVASVPKSRNLLLICSLEHWKQSNSYPL